MKKLLVMFVLITACLVVMGATLPEDAPRNVRMRAQVEGDSISFRLQWNAPQRGRFDVPILGYDWELWSAPTLGGLDLLLGSGATAPNDRKAEVAVAFDCAQSPTYYTGRVRATGDFSDVAPWGSADPFTMTCNDSPPGPPIVDLDTIPADTSTVEPDSLVLLAVELGHAGWDRETQKFSFVALGDVAKMCAFAYRNGAGHLAPRASNVATMDTTRVVTRHSVVIVSDAEPLESACWNLVANGNGSAEIHLCTTDCPAVIAGFLPHWMKWPLIILGSLLWAFGIWQDRRKKRCVRSS